MTSRPSSWTSEPTTQPIRVILAEAAGGDAIDASDVPDECWAELPPMALVAESDRLLLPAAAEDAFPMTRQQIAMAVQLLMGGARRRRNLEAIPAYQNVATSYLKVPGVDVAAFLASGQSMIEQHEMLRSLLDLHTYSCPMQVVLHRAEHPLVEVRDLRSLLPGEQQQQLDYFASDENSRTLDLRRPPLVRFTVHLLGDTRIALTITEPHAIADGWSTHLNLIEFLERYAVALGVAGSQLPPDAPKSAPLREHSAQQLWQLHSKTDLEWWKSYLQGTPRESGEQSGAPQYVWRESLRIAESDCRAIKRLAEQSGTGLKSVWLAVHLHALAQLSGQRSILTGVTVNTRLSVSNGVDARGMFLNVVPLRVEIDKADPRSVSQADRELRKVTIRGRTPLAELVRRHGPHALPTSLFVFNSFHSVAGSAERLGIDTLENFEDWSHTNFPFEASFNRSEEASDTTRLLLFSEFSRFRQEETSAAYIRAIHAFVELGQAP